MKRMQGGVKKGFQEKTKIQPQCRKRGGGGGKEGGKSEGSKGAGKATPVQGDATRTWKGFTGKRAQDGQSA